MNDANAIVEAPTVLGETVRPDAAEWLPQGDVSAAHRPWAVGASGYLPSVDPERVIGPIRTLVVMMFGAAWAGVGIWGNSLGLVLSGGFIALLGVWWTGHRWASERSARRLQRKARAREHPAAEQG